MSSYVVIVIIVILFAVAGFCTFMAVRAYKKNSSNKNRMELAGPVIARMSALAKTKVRELGIGECPDYSTAGYEFFEYKTKCHYEDNLHLLMDDKTRQIVCYQLVPFSFDPKATYNDLQFFEVHSYSDLIKAEIVNSLGAISSTGIGVGTGASVAGVPIGVGVSNTTSTQMVNALCVTMYFSDGETALVNFLNNQRVAMGGSIYNDALFSANKLLALCEQIIKDNEAPKSEGLSALVELQKLLDQNIITPEEFEAKKKQILNL